MPTILIIWPDNLQREWEAAVELHRRLDPLHAASHPDNLPIRFVVPDPEDWQHADQRKRTMGRIGQLRIAPVTGSDADSSQNRAIGSIATFTHLPVITHSEALLIREEPLTVMLGVYGSSLKDKNFLMACTYSDYGNRWFFEPRDRFISIRRAWRAANLDRYDWTAVPPISGFDGYPLVRVTNPVPSPKTGDDEYDQGMLCFGPTNPDHPASLRRGDLMATYLAMIGLLPEHLVPAPLLEAAHRTSRSKDGSWSALNERGRSECLPLAWLAAATTELASRLPSPIPAMPAISGSGIVVAGGTLVVGPDTTSSEGLRVPLTRPLAPRLRNLFAPDDPNRLGYTCVIPEAVLPRMERTPSISMLDGRVVDLRMEKEDKDHQRDLVRDPSHAIWANWIADRVTMRDLLPVVARWLDAWSADSRGAATVKGRQVPMEGVDPLIAEAARRLAEPLWQTHGPVVGFFTPASQAHQHRGKADSFRWVCEQLRRLEAADLRTEPPRHLAQLRHQVADARGLERGLQVWPSQQADGVYGFTLRTPDHDWLVGWLWLAEAEGGAPLGVAIREIRSQALVPWAPAPGLPVLDPDQETHLANHLRYTANAELTVFENVRLLLGRHE